MADGVRGDPGYRSPRYVPATCAVCVRCYFDTHRGRCVYDGPYTGYEKRKP